MESIVLFISTDSVQTLQTCTEPVSIHYDMFARLKLNGPEVKHQQFNVLHLKKNSYHIRYECSVNVHISPVPV